MRLLLVVPGTSRDAAAARRAMSDREPLATLGPLEVAFAGDRSLEVHSVLGGSGDMPGWRRFAAASSRSAALPGQRAMLDEERAYVRARGPDAPELLEHLHREGTRYDLVLFYGYAAASTAFGLPLVPERAILVPLAEDTPELRLTPYRALFHAPRAIAYRSEEEHALVSRTFRNGDLESRVAADGEALAGFVAGLAGVATLS